MSKRIILLVVILLSFPLVSCNVFYNDTETSVKSNPDETKQDTSEESNITNEENNDKESFETKESKTTKYIKFPKVKLYTGNGSEYIDVTKNHQKIFYPIYDRYYNLIYYSDFKCTLEEDSFVVEFEFEDILDKSVIMSSIDLHGYEDTVIKIDEDNKLFRILFKNVSADEEIPITIKNSLKSYLDESNEQYKQLKEALNFTIVTVESTKAQYKVQGVETTLEFPKGVLYNEDIYDNETLFTNEPKQIEILFTNNVNKKSVESVLNEEFSQEKADYSLTWIDGKTLLIDIKDFKDSSFFHLELNNALDERGLNIENNFYFTMDVPNELMYWDVEKNSISKVKTFHDKIYHVKDTPSINNYLLLADIYNEYSFNIEDNKMTLLSKELGVPYYLSMTPVASILCWVNDSTVAYYNDKSIIIYSIKNDEIQRVIELKDHLGNINVFELQTSPDGKMFALATWRKNENSEEFPVDKVYVFNMDGEKIYESNPLMFRQDWFMGEFRIANLCWLSNEEVIYESGNYNDIVNFSDYYQNKKVDVIVSNIISRKTDILVEDAIITSIDSLSNVITVRRFEGNYHELTKDCLLIHKDNVTQLNITNPLGYNINMLNNNTIIYNRTKSIGEYNYIKEIVIYNLITEEEKVIGKGYIIGFSPDRKKVYFMTNQKYLLYYD